MLPLHFMGAACSFMALFTVLLQQQCMCHYSWVEWIQLPAICCRGQSSRVDPFIIKGAACRKNIMIKGAMDKLIWKHRKGCTKSFESLCTVAATKLHFIPSISNKHKFKRAFWAHGLNSLRALTNVYGPKGNNLNLKVYKINAWIFLIGSASICIQNFQGSFGPIHQFFRGPSLIFKGWGPKGPSYLKHCLSHFENRNDFITRLHKRASISTTPLYSRVYFPATWRECACVSPVQHKNAVTSRSTFN